MMAHTIRNYIGTSFAKIALISISKLNKLLKQGNIVVLLYRAMINLLLILIY